MDAFLKDSSVMVPELHAVNGRTDSVSKSFTDLTGYTQEELLGLPLSEVMKGRLKATWVPKDDTLPEKDEECFIFSKAFDAKKVTVSMKAGEETGHLVLTFTEKETDLTRLAFSFLEQIHVNSDTGLMILTAEEFTLLRANRFITDYVSRYYNASESCIGETIFDMFRRFGGIPFEELRDTIPYPTESVHVDEFRYEFPFRGVTYWDIVLSPIQEESVVKYIILIVREVTETVVNRQRLEEQAITIQHKNQQLQAIFDNVSDGLYIEDYSGEETTYLVNRKTVEFFKSFGVVPQNPEEIKNFRFYDKAGNLLSPEKLPISRLRKGERYEQTIYTFRPKGVDVHLSISGTPLFDADNKLKMAILCSQLVTEQVNHEKELQQQRDLYYYIFDMLGLPVIYFSYPDFEFRGMNRNAFEIIKSTIKGTALEKAPNLNTALDSESFRKLYQFFNRQNQFTEVFTEMEKKKETTVCNYEMFREEEKTVYKLVIQPILKSGQEIREVIITGMDITLEIEQREAVERLVKMKDELVYTITHEFKTPLSVINSAIQAMELLCWNAMPAKAKDYVRKIKQNSFRQLRLVNNLLDVNKISIGKMKIHLSNMDIVKTTRLIIDSVQVYAQQKGIRLLFSSSTDSRLMGIDDEKYERVLLNLLSNAIKFSACGKSVYIRVSLKRHLHKLMACIEVEDEGIGIPEDKFDLIFEHFGQVDSSLARNVEGSGLGLALVKQLVEALGGEIGVSSRLGEGSTFTVLLPARKAPSSAVKTNENLLMKNHLEQVAAMELSDIRI